MAESDADDFESADEGEEYADKNLKESIDDKAVNQDNQINLPSTNDKLESVTNKLQELDCEEEKAKTVPSKSADESDHDVKKTNVNPPAEDRNLTSVLDKLSSNDSTPEKSSSWGWGSWGASLVSTATASVSTFTNQLGEGINTVLESVEDVLGAPPPEQLAAQQKEIEKQETTVETVESDKSELKTEQSLFSGLASLTGVLEKTGTKVLTTGLDTLELLGKKTMDVLQEGDPGLKNKRSIFRGPNTSLSEVLREAKNKADIRASNEILERKKANYSILFDNYQGLIHLEALEMLSKENEDRLPSIVAKLPSDAKSDLKEQFKTISELCVLSDYDEDEERKDNFEEILTEEIPLLHPDLKVARLREVYNKSQSYLKNYQDTDETVPVSREEIHSHAIEILAEFTASIMEFLHKLAELILLQYSDGNDITLKLSSVVKAFCLEINETATKFSEFLNRPSQNSTPDDQDALNALTTEIFLEASNSGTYVEDALLLMIPILQVVRAETYVTEN